MYALTVDGTDGSRADPSLRRSGMRSIDVFVDGVQEQPLLQHKEISACPEGSCSLTLTWIFVGARYGPGVHTVRVVGRHQAGQSSEQSFTIVKGNFLIGEALVCTAMTELLTFAAYHVGPVFEGLPLTDILRQCESPADLDSAERALGATPVNFIDFIYGDCAPASDPDDSSCDLPLQIQSWPACMRSRASYSSEPGVRYPREETTVRGVPAAWFDDRGRLEIYTDRTTVVIFGTDVAQMLRAADGMLLFPLNQPPGSVPTLPPTGSLTPGGPLAPPADGPLEGLLPC